jgi:hypothetical protein
MGLINRAYELLKNRWALVPLLAVCTVGLVGTRLPLSQLPGYELGELLTIALGLLMPLVGITAARAERLRTRAGGAGALATVLSPFFVTVLLGLGAVLLPFLLATVGALTTSQCNPFATMAFFPLLTVPTLGLAAAWGTLLGFASQRLGRSALGYVALVLGALAYVAWPILTGPQVFAFSGLYGYLPGPLYDEALQVTSALGWFRLQTLISTVFVLTLATALLNPHRAVLTLRPGSLGTTVLLILCFMGWTALEQNRTTLGFGATYASVQEALGGKEETAHFTLYYPRGKKRGDIERMARDIEFRFSQTADFLGSTAPGKASVFWYRNAGEKNRLVGASNTQYAKPWLREIHINDAPFPHEVLKHELVHALAAPFGAPPFGVTATFFGLFPHAGIIEGLAVAIDNRVDDLTLHQWAKGMQQLDLLPDPAALMKPAGFYAAPPSRAYTAAGSFLRWLQDTHGPDKLRALYLRGDFAGVYGQSLEALGKDWLKFLEGVPLDEEGKQLAYARFRRASIFARACAREVANLSQEASQFLASDPTKALDAYRRCAQLQPDEPSFQMGEARALARMELFAESDAVYERLANAMKAYPSSAADALMERVDLAVKTGKRENARVLLDEIIALRVSPTMDRTARVKKSALESEGVREAMWRYFDDGSAEVKTFTLRDAWDKAPTHAMLSYLLGRRLASQDEHLRASGYLDIALADAGLPLSLRRESLRLKLESAFMSGDCDQVREWAAHPPWDEGALALSLRAQEWAARCNFEQRVFGGVLKAGP